MPVAAGSGAAPLPVPIPDHLLLRPIGKGSYGEVWLARTVLGIHRAVKIVRRQAFTDDRPFDREFAGIQRFEPISRSHESQLNILHIGRGPDYFYYVMELADDAGQTPPTPLGGTSSASPTPPRRPDDEPAFNPETYTARTLRSDLLFRGRLPVDDCIRLGLALTTALEHLHRHGLVHRDIKPSNIVFVNGIPKLADIGLVALAESTMSFVGTEGYIPPEGPGTPQADIFSLGKVLYEVSTGRDRQQFPELPTNIVELPDRGELLELNEVLTRACHPNPAERYASAAEMHADLALLHSGKSVSRMRHVERRLRFLARTGAVVTAVALAAAAAWLWQQRQTREARRLADENRVLAEEKGRLALTAQQSEQITRENLYAADINLAHQALLANNLRQARSLLQRHVPQSGPPDLRGFEWRYLWNQCRGEELFSLGQQTNHPTTFAFLPDGRRLAVVTADGLARVWDVESRHQEASFTQSGAPHSVSSSPDGSLVATTTTNEVAVWDAHSWTPVHRFPEPGWLCPDGRYLLTADRSTRMDSGIHLTASLRLWNLRERSLTNTLTVPKSWRHPLMSEAGRWATFSPDGQRLAILCADAIRVFTVPGFQEIAVLTRPLSAGASANPFIRFSPDNHTLATLDSKGFGVELWDIESRRQSGALPGHSDALFDAAFAPDGSRLATCGADQTIKLWDVANRSLLRSFRGQAERVAFSGDGSRLATAREGIVSLWDPNTKPRPESFREPIGPLGFDPKGALVAVGEDMTPVRIDPATLQVTRSDPLPLTNSRAFVLSLGTISIRTNTSERWYSPYLGNLCSDGRTVGFHELWEQTMDIWDLEEHRLLCSLPSLKPWLAFAPQRRLVATDTANATTTVWQLPSGVPKWVLTNRVGLFQAIAFSPDENLMVTDEGSQMKLWRIEEDRISALRSFNHRRWPAIGLAFSPDGRLLATGESGGTIKLWSMPSAQPAGTLQGHTFSVLSLAFSTDGRTLASMCDDRTVRLWHVTTQREMLRFQSSTMDHSYFSLAFSPDGRALAANRVDDAGAVTWVWHAPSLNDIAAMDPESGIR